MSRYAEGTSVSVGKSKIEIERIVTRYGADQFQSGWDSKIGKALIEFRWKSRCVRFLFTIPNKDEFRFTPAGKVARNAAAQEKAWEQAQRQRWRALTLVIKAKFEAIESGITTFDEEFLAQIILPNNRTTGEFLLPQIDKAFERDKMPKMLTMFEEEK